MQQCLHRQELEGRTVDLFFLTKRQRAKQKLQESDGLQDYKPERTEINRYREAAKPE